MYLFSVDVHGCDFTTRTHTHAHTPPSLTPPAHTHTHTHTHICTHIHTHTHTRTHTHIHTHTHSTLTYTLTYTLSSHSAHSYHEPRRNYEDMITEKYEVLKIIYHPTRAVATKWCMNISFSAILRTIIFILACILLVCFNVSYQQN